MNNQDKKTVLLELVVPRSKYCWDYKSHCACTHFDNRGGISTCDMRFYGQRETKYGILKPPACLALQEKEH